MARYAYMKLDEEETDVSRQALLLDPMGDFEKIFVDQPKQKNHREQRQRLITGLTSQDLVYAAAADRLSDNTRDFLLTVNRILNKGAHLVLLEENLDTRTANSRQALRLLTVFAELDYKWQSDRKKEGISKAREQGRRIGRPPVSVPTNFRQICSAWSQGQISGVEAARQSGLKNTSFYKKAGELGFKAPPRKHKEL